MKKEFITLSILSSSLILFYFLFPVLQENIFKKEINVNKKENLYSDQIPQTLQSYNASLLTFDIVRISKKGDVVMAGKSEPNETIELLDGEEIIAEVSSDENGIWKFIIKKNDYSNEEISIKAKINDETLILTYNENEIQKRFKKTNFEFYDDRIIVQKGNSLWRIARKTLGGGVFYTEIYKNNLRKIKNPNLIYPGQVFNIPIKRKKKII